jgi:hypothetical protein
MTSCGSHWHSISMKAWAMYGPYGHGRRLAAPTDTGFMLIESDNDNGIDPFKL